MVKILNIAVCEDNDHDAKLIISLIKQYFYSNHVPCEITRFRNGGLLKSKYVPGFFSVVFMDIYMSGEYPDGIDASSHIHKTDPDCKIVFTTSSRDFAIESYKLRAVHYLVKPISLYDIQETMDRCRSIILKEMQFLSVMSNRTESKVFLKDIIYIEYYNRKTIIHIQNGTIETYKPLSEIEKEIKDPAFLRCHKGYIVNMDKISKIQNNDFLMKNGDLINIRTNKSKEIKDAYIKYFFEKTMES